MSEIRTFKFLLVPFENRDPKGSFVSTFVGFFEEKIRTPVFSYLKTHHP